jgi:ParB family chromosome partitioning protein
MRKEVSVVAVNPFRCRVWTLHNRLEELITEESCKDEIRSFQQHGQLVPALGRPVPASISGEDIELICGVRRLFIARHLNKPLLVELREMSDMDAVVAMDIENRQRQDISPYERGIGYARLLHGGYFESQEKLASALKVSPAHVSRLLKMARLPSVVVGAFGSAMEICEGWGLDLATALESPVASKRILKAAREIAAVSPRPMPRDVYRELLSCTTQGRRPKPAPHEVVVKGEDGVPLFRIRHQRSSIALVLPIGKVSAEALEAIRLTVTEILEHTGAAQSATERASRSNAMDNSLHAYDALPG